MGGLVVVLGLLLAPLSSAVAAFDDVVPITEGAASLWAVAHDREGDATYLYIRARGDQAVLTLRTRHADGRMGPELDVHVFGEDEAFNDLTVAVDDEGDGLVTWSWEPPSAFMEGHLSGRRFTSNGTLGPVLDLAPPEHYVTITETAVAPDGHAVVTWDDTTGRGYVPYVRTVFPGGDVGPVTRVGPGPDAHPPLIAMERSGRATLVWTNEKLMARHVSPSGELSRLRTVRAPSRSDEHLVVTEVDVDRRGVVTAACARRSRNTLLLPEDDSYVRACMLRISSRVRLLGEVRTLSPTDLEIDGEVRVGVSPSGRSVVGWQRRYFDGAWVQAVSPVGTVGRRVKVGTGGIGDIVLTGDGDGVVASTSRAPDGYYRIIRATTVRNGRIRSGEVAATSDYDTNEVYATLTSGRRAVVAWEETLEPGVFLVAQR